jgi:hypothetical protein
MITGKEYFGMIVTWHAKCVWRYYKRIYDVFVVLDFP